LEFFHQQFNLNNLLAHALIPVTVRLFELLGLRY
jgi:hypothetical protein